MEKTMAPIPGVRQGMHYVIGVNAMTAAVDRNFRVQAMLHPVKEEVVPKDIKRKGERYQNHELGHFCDKVTYFKFENHYYIKIGSQEELMAEPGV